MDKSRLGQFFFLIGMVMLIIFFGTDQSQNPQYLLFFLGGPLTGLGLFMYWRFRKPPQPTNRFSGMRRLMQSSKEPKQPKEKPAQKEKKKFFGIWKS